MTTDTPARTASTVPHRREPLERWNWLTAAVPALVTLLVMLWGLQSTSLWRDEAATITMAQRPWGSFVATLARVDSVHTLYYLIMRPVVAIFGTGEVAIRMPSVLAMAAAAALTAMLGRRLASARAGLFAGLLLATVFPLITKYTQEARSYPFVTALAVLSTYLFVRALDKGTGRSFVAYGAALAVTGLIHLFSLPLLLVHAVALLPVATRNASGGAVDRTLLKRWGITAAGVLVATGPLALYSQGQSDQVSWITRPDRQTLVDLVTMLGGSNLTLVPMLVLAGLGLTVGAGRARVDLRWLLVAWILLPPALLIGISLAHPIYLFRYVLYCIPPVALLAGIGLARIRLWAALPVGLAVVLLSYPAQRDARTITAKADDLRALADILRAHEQPGDAVVFHHAIYQRITVAYPDAFAPLKNPAFGKSAYQIHSLEPSDTNAATFQRRLSTFDRVWYIDNTTTFVDPLDSVKQKLVRRSGAFTQVQRWKYRGGALYLFERK